MTSWATPLAELRQLAAAGQLDLLCARATLLASTYADVPEAQLDCGSLLQDFGFISAAETCFQRIRAIDPVHPCADSNLANLARDAGQHARCSQLYGDLAARFPDHLALRRNRLTSLEYDPAASDHDRFAAAKAWGEWAIQRAGGPRPRPPLAPLAGRPLRLGYVSADLCQHTVGLFLMAVVKAHDPGRVIAYAYSAGSVDDWVTAALRACTQFRDVAALDDLALAERIRADGIDVLVDLSGHTAGSRLTAFAYRPAPVMVAWLGYFATTGLSILDAILMDPWHVPPGAEDFFSEPLIRLPHGRFCYTAVPWAPAVSPAPTFARGYITFGSCNNTAKLNADVFDLWARILSAVPDSRLLLKWRTFNDAALRQSVTEEFSRRGIAAHRLELRGPSFHADLLQEYADIDIGLDPFPFTGGLTSCEALWMGVPVVTWPQSRAVSRQSFALLSVIGMPELAAVDADDYVRIAVELARDRQRLEQLRASLRAKMQNSPLCDVAGFTRGLENSLIELYGGIARCASVTDSAEAVPKKILLNIGATPPALFRAAEWEELQLELDPAHRPGELGRLLGMGNVAAASVDAICITHAMEHLYPTEIPAVLKECGRVLKPDGYLVVACSDLQAAAEWIAQDKLLEVAYDSPVGPVTPFDMVYAHRRFSGRDKPEMAHHCGFTLKVLIGTLQSNGFLAVAGKRRAATFELWAVATSAALDDEALRELAGKILPE